ncbi:MAG: type II toxin-antitoxin system VapC family toxin [Gracilibacteraceae bacterium]|jgi:tRNA(fMet)-specific endonuclease VapC|nr:type II toxin-antitoxin system VapC family toxin [Gracilibacteraceae bacterium]
MLDTNTCVFLMKNRMETVEQYKRNKQYGIAVSMITVSELQFGVYNSNYPEKNAANLLGFLTGFNLFDYDVAAACEYGRIRAALRRAGTPIGHLDTLIAAHAKSRNLTLVTNNTREFERISGLELTDWLNL